MRAGDVVALAVGLALVAWLLWVTLEATGLLKLASQILGAP